MDFNIEKLFHKAPAIAVCALAFGLLGSLSLARNWLWKRTLEAEEHAEMLDEASDDMRAELEQEHSLLELKRRDLKGLKSGLPGAAQSRRALYEAGLDLQEEKRLLEKQWEMLSTYVLIDPVERKVHLMRGEQSLESFPLQYNGPIILGDEKRVFPPATEIVSKERFAHPERGKSETVNGKLEWTPPQVGTSVRANALGEYVIFTRGPLILHGPPTNDDDHRKFPHACLGLSLQAASALFKDSYIGTRIFLKGASSKPTAGGFADVDIASRTAKIVSRPKK